MSKRQPLSQFTTVNDVVSKHPAVAMLFDRHGVHTYCYGDLILPVAAVMAGLTWSELMESLHRAMAEPQ